MKTLLIYIYIYIHFRDICCC